MRRILCLLLGALTLAPVAFAQSDRVTGIDEQSQQAILFQDYYSAVTRFGAEIRRYQEDWTEHRLWRDDEFGTKFLELVGYSKQVVGYLRELGLTDQSWSPNKHDGMQVEKLAQIFRQAERKIQERIKEEKAGKIKLPQFYHDWWFANNVYASYHVLTDKFFGERFENYGNTFKQELLPDRILRAQPIQP